MKGCVWKVLLHPKNTTSRSTLWKMSAQLAHAACMALHSTFDPEVFASMEAILTRRKWVALQTICTSVQCRTDVVCRASWRCACRLKAMRTSCNVHGAGQAAQRQVSADKDGSWREDRMTSVTDREQQHPQLQQQEATRGGPGALIASLRWLAQCISSCMHALHTAIRGLGDVAGTSRNKAHCTL